MADSSGSNVVNVVEFKSKIKEYIRKLIGKYGHIKCGLIYDKLCSELDSFINKTKAQTLEGHTAQAKSTFNVSWNNAEEIIFLKNTFEEFGFRNICYPRESVKYSTKLRRLIQNFIKFCGEKEDRRSKAEGTNKYTECTSYNNWIDTERQSFQREYLAIVAKMQRKNVLKYFRVLKNSDNFDPNQEYLKYKLDCSKYSGAPPPKFNQPRIPVRHVTHTRPSGSGISNHGREPEQFDKANIPKVADAGRKKIKVENPTADTKSSGSDTQTRTTSTVTQMDNKGTPQDTQLIAKTPAPALDPPPDPAVTVKSSIQQPVGVPVAQLNPAPPSVTASDPVLGSPEHQPPPQHPPQQSTTHSENPPSQILHKNSQQDSDDSSVTKSRDLLIPPPPSPDQSPGNGPDQDPNKDQDENLPKGQRKDPSKPQDQVLTAQQSEDTDSFKVLIPPVVNAPDSQKTAESGSLPTPTMIPVTPTNTVTTPTLTAATDSIPTQPTVSFTPAKADTSLTSLVGTIPPLIPGATATTIPAVPTTSDPITVTSTGTDISLGIPPIASPVQKVDQVLDPPTSPASSTSATTGTVTTTMTPGTEDTNLTMSASQRPVPSTVIVSSTNTHQDHNQIPVMKDSKEPTLKDVKPTLSQPPTSSSEAGKEVTKLPKDTLPIDTPSITDVDFPPLTTIVPTLLIITTIATLLFLLHKYTPFGLLIGRRKKKKKKKDLRRLSLIPEKHTYEATYETAYEWNNQGLEDQIMENDLYIKLLKLKRYKKTIQKKEKQKGLTLVEVHMEILEECKNVQWELHKGNFLEICIQEFIDVDYIIYTNSRNSELTLNNIKNERNIEDIEKQEILWNTWIENHRSILEKWKKEVWFQNLKNEWKKELQLHNEEIDKLEENNSNEPKVQLIASQIDIWKQWITKKATLIESISQEDWFKSLTDVTGKEEYNYGIDGDNDNALVTNKTGLEKETTYHKHEKKYIVEKLMVQMHIMALEECIREEFIKNKELYMDKYIEDIHTQSSYNEEPKRLERNNNDSIIHQHQELNTYLDE
ncbi:STP1 protein [Plasmodium ovale wallikeri]|uniref:STP1 protein n=1 Tax=Plasmodium ovale wallikeri TaxID=864142 RepID=A0A1A9AHS9_PLAOA|nr:STP1 protein [Plasmodium ovale wallikeri]